MNPRLKQMGIHFIIEFLFLIYKENFYNGEKKMYFNKALIQRSFFMYFEIYSIKSLFYFEKYFQYNFSFIFQRNFIN